MFEQHLRYQHFYVFISLLILEKDSINIYNALKISHTHKYNFPKIHKFQSNSPEIKLTLELYILFQHLEYQHFYVLKLFLISQKYSRKIILLHFQPFYKNFSEM